MKEIFLRLLKKEPILFAAFLLAVVTSVICIPDKGVFNAIDYRVLLILLSLMMVVKGLENEGVLERTATVLLKRVKTDRQLYMALVLLCFFSSMFITNDVALITFVPLALRVLNMAGRKEKIIKIVVLQTIAANMGSVLMPMGNPQNLYLYSLSGVSGYIFISAMAPMWVLSLIYMVFVIFIEKNGVIEKVTFKSKADINIKKTAVYTALFAVCVLAVLHAVDYRFAAAIVLCVVFITDKKIILRADYNLLLTFIFFFVFVYNIKNLSTVSLFFEKNLSGNEFLCGFILSQIISNVPAAILLSGFTQNYMLLLAGVNIGGLGTLIASMASLISYKMYAGEKNADIKKYLSKFLKYNVEFIILLIPAVIIAMNRLV